MSGADEDRLRRDVVETARAMGPAGINTGKSGNVSVRCGDGLLITPSALPYADMTPVSVVRMDEDGRWSAPAGLRPSSEWRMHRDLLRARPELGAVVHAHPTFAVAIGIVRPRIPPIHYMIVLAGGTDIRVAPYRTFGTAELSEAALAAMDGRRACLLAHHGLLAAGRTAADALALAVEVEALARQYHACLALGAGEPPVLTGEELAAAARQFAEGYGAAPPAPAEGTGAPAPTNESGALAPASDAG